MKITKVDIMIQNPPEGFDDAAGWRPVTCRIYTDEGIYGDGEAAMAYGRGAPAAFGMIRDLSPLIIGMDPLANEIIWEKLYKCTFWGQNGGPVVFAGISAIDIALWDIRGKYFNAPIYQLLGGMKQDKLRTYASQLQLGWGDDRTLAYTPEEYARNAKWAVEDGYDAIKVDFFHFNESGSTFNYTEHTGLLSPYYLNLIEARVAAVREAVGPDVDIIMENHSYPDAVSAVQIGRRVQKYNIFCFEEPSTPTPKLTKQIHDQLEMPIASGERIYTRWQYAQYFENGCIQLIQPDLGNCGGITEGKKICDMAHAYDVGVQAHACGSPLSTAAALHLEAAIPNFVIHEHHINSRGLYNRRLCIHDYQPKNGVFEVPDLPGLGNELSEYALTHCEKITVE